MCVPANLLHQTYNPLYCKVCSWPQRELLGRVGGGGYRENRHMTEGVYSWLGEWMVGVGVYNIVS